MTYKIWNVTRNKSSCEIAGIRESAEIALKKETQKKCTMWKENMGGFADMKMYAEAPPPSSGFKEYKDVSLLCILSMKI